MAATTLGYLTWGVETQQNKYGLGDLGGGLWTFCRFGVSMRRRATELIWMCGSKHTWEMSQMVQDLVMLMY